MTGSALRDGVALALGTFTRVPVPPPTTVDRRVAGVAMLLGPVVGAVLGLAVGTAAQALSDHTQIGPLLAAGLAVATIAYLTRALHLDGLADTADALGSGRPPEEALAVARRSDIGPFGVVTVVLVLLVQVAALTQALGAGTGPLVLAVALGSGRLAIAVGCVRGVRAARADGLGAAVAESVRPVPLAVVCVSWVVACAVGALLTGAATAGALAAAGAAVCAVLAGGVLLRIGVRRLGGVTGDVLGAVTEVGTTASLVAFALFAAVPA